MELTCFSTADSEMNSAWDHARVDARTPRADRRRRADLMPRTPPRCSRRQHVDIIDALRAREQRRDHRHRLGVPCSRRRLAPTDRPGGRSPLDVESLRTVPGNTNPALATRLRSSKSPTTPRVHAMLSPRRCLLNRVLRSFDTRSTPAQRALSAHLMSALQSAGRWISGQSLCRIPRMTTRRMNTKPTNSEPIPRC